MSYANARQFLEVSALVVGPTAQMPGRQREILLSRAMGRALAHEMGHYLLASKVHTMSGLSGSSLAPAQSRGAKARLAVLQLPIAEVTPRYRRGA